MALKMIEPTKHSKSGRYRIRLTIPAALRTTAKKLYGVGVEFTANLNTTEKREALALAPAALAELKAKLKLVEALHSGDLKALSQREIRALTGEWYRETVALNEDNPTTYEGWDAYQSELLDARTYPEGDPDDGLLPDYEPDRKALEEARSLLSARGLVAHEAFEAALAVALWEAKLHYSALMMRRARGDYGPDKFVETLWWRSWVAVVFRLDARWLVFMLFVQKRKEPRSVSAGGSWVDRSAALRDCRVWSPPRSPGFLSKSLSCSSLDHHCS